jgi:hypothetical protein
MRRLLCMKFSASWSQAGLYDNNTLDKDQGVV